MQHTKKEVRKSVLDLIKQINRHNQLYYEKQNPQISDYEYDLLVKKLQDLFAIFPELSKEINDNPLEKIGYKPSISFTKHKHREKMFSLSNGFSIKDIEDFIQRCTKYLNIGNKKLGFCCEMKIDGLSFSAIYKNGLLDIALTRGDGEVGEVVTDNIKQVINFPVSLKNYDPLIHPEIIEVRGEVYMDKRDFISLNKSQKDKGFDLFSNPRNAASGSLRQLDISVTSKRKLKYFAYSFGFNSEKLITSQVDALLLLKKFGFEVNNSYKLLNNIKSIEEFYTYVQQARDVLVYDIDGLVYKVNDINMQQRMGHTTKYPRFAIAHKFPITNYKTRIIDIEYQIGRTGAITPVAVVEPVNMDGVIVSRATLHNFDEIKRLDIKVNDIVNIHRAGDVIPKITSCDKEKRSDSIKNNINLIDIIIPLHCPLCKSDLDRLSDINCKEGAKGGVIIKCNNIFGCRGQILERIKHFVSKKAFDIQGLGAKQIEIFTKKGFIKNIIDIFYLESNNKNSLNKIENISGFGKLSVQKLFYNINQSKTISLDRFIYSLSIEHIGKANSHLIAKELCTVDNFIDALKEIKNLLPSLKNIEDSKSLDIHKNINNRFFHKLINIDGIGDKLIISGIGNFVSYNSNMDLVTKLVEIIDIQEYKEEKIIENELSGKIIVFTGSMKSLSRDEAKNIAKKIGAKVSSSISSNTDLLIASNVSMTGKVKKTNSTLPQPSLT
ncbi:MAG TPA: NAD-dependent DNA ligase LigA, partial [Candidatus Megaira endosymbiont of Hartmannula sinica]|nr:NAD-dependent DNA ligase LigA [Candidatus Megaera endosymbiont of Hartmannula sinica]